MIVACVRAGFKYRPSYVYKLKAMVARHLPLAHRFVCLTDFPEQLPGIECVLIATDDILSGQLKGWWNKMAVFRQDWRDNEEVIYFDLDTVICGDLIPLAQLDIEFGICENFTRLAGNIKWPCRYGSCVMVLKAGFGDQIWDAFIKHYPDIIDRAGLLGDQKAIEELYPSAVFLQDILPKGFFLGYRHLTSLKPKDCSVVVFAGTHKPDNCRESWIKKEWTAEPLMDYRDCF